MTRAEALKETSRALAVAELRRRSAQKLIESEYLSGSKITEALVARRNAMEAQIESLRYTLNEAVSGLTPQELDAMADEIEGLR